jgi:8-oxo-dGTP diphosphatase
MPANLKAEVCVGAAIVRRGRLLLLRRSSEGAFPGVWEIPGGHVETGESLEVALRREVREETGLTVRVEQPFHVWSYAYPSGHQGTVPTVEIDFHCSLRALRAPRVNPKEHVEFAWVRRSELSQYPTDPRLDALHRRAFETRH